MPTHLHWHVLSVRFIKDLRSVLTGLCVAPPRTLDISNRIYTAAPCLALYKKGSLSPEELTIYVKTIATEEDDNHKGLREGKMMF